MALEDGGMVTWFGQVAVRQDGGDGETGGGAEVTGGLRYDSSGRFGLEAKARMLAMHAADEYEENGFSVSAFCAAWPGRRGGVVLAFVACRVPVWAWLASHWSLGYGRPGVDSWRATRRLGRSMLGSDTRSWTTACRDSLTPFAEVDVADDRGHTMLGIALDLSGRRALDRLNVEFAGGRGYHELRGAAGGVFAMRGELRF